MWRQALPEQIRLTIVGAMPNASPMATTVAPHERRSLIACTQLSQSFDRPLFVPRLLPCRTTSAMFSALLAQRKFERALWRRLPST